MRRLEQPFARLRATNTLMVFNFFGVAVTLSLAKGCKNASYIKIKFFMLPPQLYEGLNKLLAQQFNQPINNLQFQSIGGGSINETYKLTFSNTHTLFCKVNHAATFPQLFLKEAQGLEALKKTATIKTPEVILNAALDESQILI